MAIKIIKVNEKSGASSHLGWPREYAVLKSLWNDEAVARHREDGGVDPQELAIARCRAFWFDKRRKEHCEFTS